MTASNDTNAQADITWRTFFTLWAEFLSELTERHVVLRAIRMRTACSSPIHNLRRARKRRKIEAKLSSIAADLDGIKRRRENDFIAEGLLQKDQALLQSDLRNI
jgi:hypothetical protein